MQSVTYTHLSGEVTVFTGNTVRVHEEWDANLQANVTSTIYVQDWGFSTWAYERLSSEELTQFQTDNATWVEYAANAKEGDAPVYDTEPFKTYWTRFYTDPNVVVVE